MTQFRNLRILSTFSDNLAQKLVYSDLLDIVVGVSAILSCYIY